MTANMNDKLGIIGGNGVLGGAIAEGLLLSGTVAPQDIWVSSRSGKRPDFPGSDLLSATNDTGKLVGACDTIILSVPPGEAQALSIPGPNKLVISVMAGITLSTIGALAQGARTVRAMSSPAAARRLAYSPYFLGNSATIDDEARVRRVFEAIGIADRVPNEDQIDRFTALTGPVPGFVAACAAAMAAHARSVGIDETTADRAVRQLFLAAGTALADGPSPEAHVAEMIAYAGTTAAGLETLRDGPFSKSLGDALQAAYERCKSIA